MTETPDVRILVRMLADHGDARFVVDNLDTAHFLDPRLRRLYLFLAPITTAGAIVGNDTLAEKLRSQQPDLVPLLERVQAVDLPLDQMLEDIEAAVEAFVTWAYNERLSASLSVVADLQAEGKPATDIRDYLAREMDALSTVTLDTRRYDDMGAQQVRLMEFAKGQGKTGLTFGYERVDRRVTPLLPGNLMVLAGAPGTGKSTVMRNFVSNWIGLGSRVAVMSLEMPGDEQLANFACMDTGLDYSRFARQILSEHEIDVLDRASRAWVEDGKLTINERASAQPDWILRQMKRYRAAGADVFVVDHLHHADYGVRENEMRVAVSSFVRSLKGFASEHSCIVVALSQYAKLDKHQEPDDNNVKESNTIAEVADKMFHVFRPKVAGEMAHFGEFIPRLSGDGRPYFSGNHDAPPGSVFEPDPTAVYLKVGKQRVAPKPGIIRLPYNEKSGRIYDEHAKQIEPAA